MVVTLTMSTENASIDCYKQSQIGKIVLLNYRIGKAKETIGTHHIRWNESALSCSTQKECRVKERIPILIYYYSYTTLYST
jgi:hypothetical protein